MTDTLPNILDARSASCFRVPEGEPLAPVRNISLSIHEGSLNAITGTGDGLLLRLLGLLDAPDEGEILFRGVETRGLPEEVRAELRNRHFGFVFAGTFLLPAFTVAENVAMPLFKISGANADEARMRTLGMLEFTGMADCEHWGVDGLTAVQQQRVSLARALVNEPDILIVENVDAGLAGEELSAFLELIQRVGSDFGITTILTAKDRGILNSKSRVIELADGTILNDSFAPSGKEAA